MSKQNDLLPTQLKGFSVQERNEKWFRKQKKERRRLELERLNDRYMCEAMMDSEHGDWGDRDDS
jgi:hypothetical protein